ncbi:MAG: hypothetical protein HC923_03590 [Myxococcales bacterium]|nr:hypothetical protein [Myxococcales bacterium]
MGNSTDGTLMAFRDRRRPRWGVQFHPESVGSPNGMAMLANFSRSCATTRRAPSDRGVV